MSYVALPALMQSATALENSQQETLLTLALDPHTWILQSFRMDYQRIGRALEKPFLQGALYHSRCSAFTVAIDTDHSITR